MARPRSDIKQRILVAARARFLREGVDGASLRAIAADAGTSIGMVYYYFRSKDELFLAVVEVPYVKLLDELTRELDPALPSRDRILAIYHRVARATPDEAEIVRLVVREALVSSSRLASIVARFQRGHIPLVLRAIADGVREGSIRDDVSPLLLLPVIAAVGAIPQLVFARLSRSARSVLPPAAALPDQLLDLLYVGIGSQDRRLPRGRGRRPTAKVLKLDAPAKPKRLGVMKGHGRIPDDLDSLPQDDIADAFDGNVGKR